MNTRSDHLTVKWLTRGGETLWQPRAIDGTVLNHHWRRKVAMATGLYSGVPVWEQPGDDHSDYDFGPPDSCLPETYRWRWRARLKARLRNRRLSKRPSSYQLDNVWHEVGR